MKHLLFAVLLLSSFSTAAHTNFGRFSSPEEPVFEISLLAGRAFDLKNDFVMKNDPVATVYFPQVRAYVNFRGWQLGAGYDMEVFNTIPKTESKTTYKTPHIVFNKIQNGNWFSYYAGVNVGYTTYEGEYSTTSYLNITTDRDVKGNGIDYGVQGGIIVKVYDFISVNGEIAVKTRHVIYDEAIDIYVVNSPTKRSYIRSDEYSYSQDDFYLPFRIGLRFRF